ncbi:MAG: hypothetical protein A2Y67_01965 [Candidatus Buchananbacteria bacterium RBG_13_39_9]|uniref:PrgI family protein n=1 Tax=Candidatus Buchananbacteria bacterium RBG_13_39_9 TaxID=1797531 RepID=A0A1G1XQ93_9BACT|nr:MAG: hypothetical protein A2Y67_01965 [Candidatus Buchananbacteria bacterium RBG_13_39_9]
MALGQFLVPQFIDVESKIIGSVTTRQFLIMMVVGMIDYILYKLLYFNTFIVVAVLLTGIFSIFAFVKINGMPFHYFFLNFVQTMRKPWIRIWTKEPLAALPPLEKPEIRKEFIAKPPLATSKLSSLTLIVNTGGAYREE